MNQNYANEISSLVRKAEDDYTTGVTNISKYVQFSQYENIERIDAYLNSKHLTGETDSLGRDKPFFNIVTAAVNIWYRATDIDRKNIRIKSTKGSTVLAAFIATLKLQEWMRKSRFGAFLNEWGRTLSKYGSSVVKFVEADGELYKEVVAWNRLISDTVNFKANPKIEKLFFTVAELRQNKVYDGTATQQLIEAQSTRKDLDGQQIDNKGNYIEVYEVHGMFPKSWITEKEEDQDEYVQQMHVVSFVLKEGKDGKSEYEDFCLFKGLEEKDPYMITHLIKEDGREQSIGAVEYLFDAQWMQNHSVKAIKDQLDLASRMLFQTSDGNFVGINVLNNLENGDILLHTPNNPITQINNGSHDIGALKTLADMFAMNGQKITGTTDAIAGNNMPSGTPYSSLALMNSESHSLFEIMTENKGLHITDMMTEYILPYIQKQLDSKEEIAELLSDNDIEMIDTLFIPNEAIRRINNKQAEEIFNGLIASPYDQLQEENSIKKEVSTLGKQRFIKPDELGEKTWKDILEDLTDWDVEVEVTNEASDKQAVLQTLSTILQVVATNPNVLQDPNQRMLFNKILEETGSFSALQLKAPPTPTPIPQASGGSPTSVGELLNKTANAVTQ